MANVEGQAGPLLFVIYQFPFSICHFLEIAEFAETLRRAPCLASPYLI